MSFYPFKTISNKHFLTRQDRARVHFLKVHGQKQPGKWTMKGNVRGLELLDVEMYYKPLTATVVLSGSWRNRPSHRIKCLKIHQNTEED